MLNTGVKGADRLVDRPKSATDTLVRCQPDEMVILDCRDDTLDFGGIRITEIVDAGNSPQSNFGIFEVNGDCWLLILQLTGRSLLLAGDNAITLDPGDLLLVDGHNPPRRQAAPYARQVCVQLPGPLLEPGTGVPQPARPCLIEGTNAIGIILRRFVCALLDLAGPLCAREETGIRDALVHLAAAAYCGARDRCVDPSTKRWNGRVARDAPLRQWEVLQQSVETLLPDPALNPAMVAALHRISTRHLHRLFRQAGLSFSSYVRSRRLEHCREDLADARFVGLPLTEIAYRWGFCDSSHFSRSFKAAFGCTAREFRSRNQRHRRSSKPVCG